MSQEQKTYGLIGKNIGYSFSKNYFLDKFLKKNMENCCYKNFDLESINNLGEVLKTPSLKGLNITIPYKEKAIRYLNEIDYDAKQIGAINTIKVNIDNTLIGYNTDYIGFIKSIKPHINSSHKKALILGTGGASKAIAYALEKLNIEAKKVSRKKVKEEITYLELDEEKINDCQIIINTTPLGTFPDIENYPDIPYEYITKKHICYDLIYNPNETVFLKKSKQNKAFIINGLNMLKIQAEESWKIWNN
jgi:shikimate dehydrogenase